MNLLVLESPYLQYSQQVQADLYCLDFRGFQPDLQVLETPFLLFGQLSQFVQHLQ